MSALVEPRIKHPEKMITQEHSFAKKMYLVCYNSFMFSGFLYAFLTLAFKYATEGDEFVPKAFPSVGYVFKFLQLVSIIEVLNPLFGFTKGSIVEATIQVFGRLIFLFLMIDAEPRMQTNPVVFYLLLTYASIEIVRYPYYLFRVFDKDVGVVTWLRYSIWVPLYPIGLISEATLAYRCIPFFEETGKFSVQLPNEYNLSFYFPNMIRAYLLIGFFPFSYTQMIHMYNQRCKRLGAQQNKSKLS